MSLQKWAEYGWLKPEPTSREEISGLLSIVDRGLADAGVHAISSDLRFVAAFNAALTCASVALRASGYRVSSPAGHHIKTIESLELTLQTDAKLIQKLRVMSKKRNTTSYDTAGSIAPQDLELMIGLAQELRAAVMVWLKKEHPEVA